MRKESLTCHHSISVLAIAVLLVAMLCLVLSYWTERESRTTQRNMLKFPGCLGILAHVLTVYTRLSFNMRKEPGVEASTCSARTDSCTVYKDIYCGHVQYNVHVCGRTWRSTLWGHTCTCTCTCTCACTEYRKYLTVTMYIYSTWKIQYSVYEYTRLEISLMSTIHTTPTDTLYIRYRKVLL